MLLLFTRLGENPPLQPGVYRTMLRTLEALGAPGRDPSKELDEAELTRLGVHPDTARAILWRLEQASALDSLLDALDYRGVTVLTRLSPEYPARLRKALGDRAPMVLYCAGNLNLFHTTCVALVGSRQLREPGRQFARRLGLEAARQGFTYVSGGAAGADTEGYAAASSQGGGAILFLPDSLRARMIQMQEALSAGKLLLVSEQGFDEPFTVAAAYSRNRLIHAMGRQVFVAQSDYGSGGTWQGVMENLKHSWSPVYVCSGEQEDPGTRGLLERGCDAVSMEALKNLRELIAEKASLFDHTDMGL